LDLIASDPQGFDVSIHGDLNGLPFSCGQSCSQPLPEGVGKANYSVTSTSGRTASGSSTWQRDGTPPDLNLVLPPLDGMKGWYVSELDVFVNATDAVSGLSSIAGSVDESATWISFPIHLTEGVHSVTAHVRDLAGNEALATEVIRVDTIPPVSQFISLLNGELVQGSVLVTGKMDDATSGVAGVELSIEGTTWQAVAMDTSNVWSFIWHSNEVPNGQYTLQIRGTDEAGNISDPTSITLVVDNGPPVVSITERWWIWETGELKVSSNHFPITSVRVTISDPGNRWPAVVLDFDPDKVPDPISWNRHFADGTLAPPGEYPVVAIACDVHNLCGSDKGIIAIPFVMTSTATVTSSPTTILTLTPQATFTPMQRSATLTPILGAPSPEISPESIQPARSIPFWQLLGLLGLFVVIASASVVDPRPAALDRLRETFRLISKQNVNGSSVNDE
jgi:Big-like domain-containing protein